MGTNDFDEKLGNLIDSLDEVAPKDFQEAEEELHFAGLDPGEVWKQMEKTVQQSIKERKRIEFIKKINSLLQIFFKEIFSPQYLQPAIIPATRLKEVGEKAEEVQQKEMTYQYPKAIQLMRQGKYKEAISILNYLINNNDETNMSKYHYTLAYVYLALNDFERAERELGLVTGEFNANAQKLLDGIQKIKG